MVRCKDCFHLVDYGTLYILLHSRQSRFIENVRSESLSQKELQQESAILGKQFVKYSRLLMLDTDSFFVFAKILLDRIPFLIKPLCRGIVTKQDVTIPTHDFKRYLDWCKENPKSMLDPAFYDKMMSFRKWFEGKLREPRDDIIVHPRPHHFRSEIRFDGKLKRIRYELRTNGGKRVWKPTTSTEFPDISRLFKKIIEFLEFLNGYFSEKLRS